ncbi:MAG: hypothetical protein H6Q42_2073 [Deltaproteobacteria bacterium]|jgi:hypothetical protein|nr:hypothetical protein [Deltaproteobacteria bacterium]
MANTRSKVAVWFFILTVFGFLILAMGCFTRLTVDRPAPPLVDLKDYQPVGILSSSDAPGFTGSGWLLLKASQDVLKEKHFAVTAPERSLQVLQDMNQSPEEVSRDARLLRRFGESLSSRILLVATFLNYRRQKSYISSGTSQVWQGASYEYQSLPTYHQGICEMKVSLKMLDAEKGTVVWRAEGSGRGPSGSEERILRQLVEDLMKDLPLLPEKRP